MGNNPLKAFNIDIFKLGIGKHEYQFHVDDAFFAQFEYSLINKGDLSIEAVLDKSETFFHINFDIHGTIELICDRSLEEFDYPVSLHERIIFKYGETEQEISDDIVMIPYGIQQLNVAQYIYELIMTAIPMKKLHPKFAEEEAEDENEFEVLVYSDVDEETSEQEQESEEEENIDPRWNALKNLLNNNKQK
jgi:uncharacterized protein